MIHIESRHIINAIRESCPLVISFSLNSITLLPPSNESKAFGVARFENDEEEKEVSCHWYVNIMPETTELVIRWIGKEEIFAVEL